MSGCNAPLAAAAPAKLAAAGKALLPIVIAENASPRVKDTAAELAAYLGRITGAEFTVQAGDGKSGIVLGTLAQFPDPTLSEPLEIRNTYDGKEACIIRTEEQRVLLIGVTDLGASHVAFRFLEELGCRWFFPVFNGRGRVIGIRMGRCGPGAGGNTGFGFKD